ncbi:flagellar basal body-associated FliL family protein [Agrobacterium genomosp. 3]|uniref:Flagellar protein FliL n=1 Tax=Agrobacterium tomkonis CFBP 6623 TaxID=1183432 RepID=A0A1S7QAG5_9HYPH|nr:MULTISPECIES: flagellar basal body-associated FliL family protein [Rhizobium/Agrobacterium group]MCA1867058.1 flagellar basal body-associated FliL family protein [Agrobacterium tomkonis]KRA58140.1 flagellar basal body protein FliL [Rhizobium sp. Root651]MCA1877410.1 flagellar basal body-associated FliL family protein [Agrobacterium tumefaciens]MCA1890056.1 flagellar basal body-associated FliL family protein [Agrobacterium tomkonis]QCL87856.1 flagellar basal body-associated FliL family prote
MENEQAESKKKSSPVVMTIAGVVILTLLGAGGGWLVGGMIAPKIAGAEAAAHAPAASAEKGKAAEGIEKISAEANGIVQLDPITTNLAYPSTNWVRLEVALMFKGPVEVGLAEDIHQDIMAYVRTVSLQQLEGPRGFQYLKDDIQERVDLRSQGRVSKVMFRTFVIE